MHDALLGLHEAHEARDDDGAPLAIVHRDVSPQNVLVGLDGLARVLDFGVAKARRTVHFSHDGEIKGKVPYMPPEQLFGEQIDRRVDVYAAGVLLWEALCGARLFEGPTEEIIVKRISDGVVPAPSARRPGIAPELDAVVLRALASDAEGRYPSALEMAERIAATVTLPTRTDVAAWVKRYARVRSSFATTSTRELTGSTTDAGAIVAAVRRSHAPAPRTGPRGMVVAFATIAIACAGFALYTTDRGAHAEAQGAAKATPPPPTSELASVAVAPTLIPTAIPTLEPTTVAPQEPIAPKAKPAMAPRAMPSSPAASATVDSPNCRPPYTLDGEGHRHYKVECL
jgi:serine/threonine-protein kinase